MTATLAADALPPRDPRGRSRARRLFFGVAKAVGLFALSRRIYRRRQCILCYHAFAFEDENRFRPQLYMDPRRFAARLDLLRRRGYRFVALDEAVRRIAAGVAVLDEVAVTIDDGFTSVHALAREAIRARQVPATLYLTTYYVEHPAPVFGLAAQYLAWKCKAPVIEFDADAYGLRVPRALPTKGRAGEEALERLIAAAEGTLDEDARTRLLEHLATRAGLSGDSWKRDRRFCLVTPAMVSELIEAGVSMELHTHRHRFPADPALLAREIDDNRRVLAALGVPVAAHLCYPSGQWSSSAFRTLAAAGVLSATTCEPGLNAAGAQPLALSRFLDADDIPEIEFEAEVAGFKQLLRDIRARIGPGD